MQPTSQTSQSKSVSDPSDNLYFQLTKERHHLVVPMLILDKEGKDELNAPMVVLTSREEQECRSLAYKETKQYFKEVPKTDEPSNWTEVFEQNLTSWYIFCASRVPGDLNKKLFFNKQQVDDQYTTEELSILGNYFLQVKLSQPHLKHLDPDNKDSFEELISEIIRSGTTQDFFLSGYTTHSLKLLIHYLIGKQKTSQQENGSSGTLSNNMMEIETILNEQKPE